MSLDWLPKTNAELERLVSASLLQSDNSAATAPGPFAQPAKPLAQEPSSRRQRRMEQQDAVQSSAASSSQPRAVQLDVVTLHKSLHGVTGCGDKMDWIKRGAFEPALAACSSNDKGAVLCGLQVCMQLVEGNPEAIPELHQALFSRMSQIGGAELARTATAFGTMLKLIGRLAGTCVHSGGISSIVEIYIGLPAVSSMVHNQLESDPNSSGSSSASAAVPRLLLGSSSSSRTTRLQRRLSVDQFQLASSRGAVSARVKAAGSVSSDNETLSMLAYRWVQQPVVLLAAKCLNAEWCIAGSARQR